MEEHEDCMPVIEISGLTKRYGSFCAVDNLNLTVREGEFMGLLGPNGAGKSTTLKAITGLVRPTSGVIKVNGVNARSHRKAMTRVGCVIETPECYRNFTPGEMLEYVGKVHGIKGRELGYRARDVLEEVRMWEWRNKQIGEFSKGMRQRVAIAAALLPNPSLIILDEPTSGLDPRGMIEVRETLRNLKERGLTLMISTHILKEVSEMCTSMTMINKGREVISGDVNTLIHNMASAEKTITLDIRTLQSMPPVLISDMRAMSGVTGLERTGDKSVRLSFAGTDEQQADIADLLMSHRMRLLSMNESGADLEKLYMKLTEGDEVNIK